MKKRHLIVIVLVPLALSFIMNVIWTATRIGWLYWGSRLLFSFEQVAISISLILFPNALLQICIGSKVEQRVIALLMAALVMSFGIYLLITGFGDLSNLASRWIVECSANIADCLR